MRLISLIATYRQMDLSELERWNSLDEKILDSKLKKIADEYVILKTCNRFEVYAILKENADEKILFSLGPKGKLIEGRNAIIHLLKVASGMDSMVPGEQEIQRQVKEALKYAINNGTSGKYMNYLFMKALNVSKEIRSSTKIGNGIVSLPQASVKIVESILPSGRVAILGTGRVANTILKYIHNKYDVEIFGRNISKMKNMEDIYGVVTHPIANIKEKIDEYDAIFSALRTDGIFLSKIDFHGKKPVVIVDLGNPRNIENPGDRYFIDLDYLKEYVSKNISIRVNEMEKAGKILEEKLESIEKKLLNFEREDVIASIYRRAEMIKEDEIKELMKYIDPEEKEKVEKFANSLIKKLFDRIARNLKEDEYGEDMLKKLKEMLG